MTVNNKHLHNRVNRDVLKRMLCETGIERTTVSFYKYTSIPNPDFFRNHLFIKLSGLNVLGRIYVAKEGINAQISVPTEKINALRTVLNEITFLKGCRLNLALEESDYSFYKLAVKVREKIVADGLGEMSIDVNNNGKHISAIEFNELTGQEDTIIIDMRNHYESEVGHFENAICPDVETFRESLPVVEKILIENKDKKVVMYCTGGIRCEKATAYYKQRGFDNLYQLDGGIIEYARQSQQHSIKNKFVGKNFVFDDRLGERVSKEIIANCHQCGRPCDTHVNCANDACHILFIQCPECKTKYESCCSVKCADFNGLPEDQKKAQKGKIRFNGSTFGKRWKAGQHVELLK